MKKQCWFCLQNHEGMKYTEEFDAFFSWVCLEDALEADPNDEEALLIKNEFGGRENTVKAKA